MSLLLASLLPNIPRRPPCKCDDWTLVTLLSLLLSSLTLSVPRCLLHHCRVRPPGSSDTPRTLMSPPSPLLSLTSLPLPTLSRSKSKMFEKANLFNAIKSLAYHGNGSK